MPGESSFAMDFRVARAAAEELIRVNNAIQTEVENLFTAVATLRASWSGAAQNEYTNVQTMWDAAHTEMNTALSGCAGSLLNIADHTQGTDNRIAASWTL